MYVARRIDRDSRALYCNNLHYAGILQVMHENWAFVHDTEGQYTIIE